MGKTDQTTEHSTTTAPVSAMASQNGAAPEGLVANGAPDDLVREGVVVVTPEREQVFAQNLTLTLNDLPRLKPNVILTRRESRSDND